VLFVRRLGLSPRERKSVDNATCPDIFELADGTFAVIGTDVTEDYKALLPPDAAVASYERIVMISRDTLVAACKATGQKGCVAFEALANLGKVADELQALADGALLPIGSFQIFRAPPEGTSRYTPPGGGDDGGEEEDEDEPTGPTTPTPPAGGAAGTGSITAKVRALTGGYMTLPILSDLPAVMNIVLGGELSCPSLTMKTCSADPSETWPSSVSRIASVYPWSIASRRASALFR
jgi:hypothetical protein